MSTSTTDPPLSGIKALCFDVFGTCVDWRTSVTSALSSAAHSALHSSSHSSSASLTAQHLTEQDWASIAQEWRSSYTAFVHRLAHDPSAPYATVDEHHLSSLRTILRTRGLEGLWSDAQVRELALVWHRLKSWADTNPGLDLLEKAEYVTATLSNGNVELLRDMQEYAGMRFAKTLSANMWGTYKPNPKVYTGAVEALGCKPEEVVMVAAHLGDLEAAKGSGLRTCFVERRREESKDLEAERARGYVDLWIAEGEGGFVALAKALAV